MILEIKVEYKKLPKQPLKFVLAEFKFSPVLQINKYVPDIQEAFRKYYPIFQKKTEQAFGLYDNNIQLLNIDRWVFISSDKSKAIELDPERIIFFTSTYNRFGGFIEDCQFALNILVDIVDPTLLQRIGLRYCDLISIEENETASNIVSKSLLGPDELSAMGTNKQQKNETTLNTSVGTLVIRSYYGEHNLICSPDLEHRLPILIQKEENLKEKILLDFDHYWESKNESYSFDIEKITDRLNNLHEVSREAFWRLTSDYARREKWS